MMGVMIFTARCLLLGLSNTRLGHVARKLEKCIEASVGKHAGKRLLRSP